MTNPRHLVQIYGIAYELTHSACGLALSISSFSEPTRIRSSLLSHPQYLEPDTEPYYSTTEASSQPDGNFLMHLTASSTEDQSSSRRWHTAPLACDNFNRKEGHTCGVSAHTTPTKTNFFSLKSFVPGCFTLTNPPRAFYAAHKKPGRFGCKTAKRPATCPPQALPAPPHRGPSGPQTTPPALPGVAGEAAGPAPRRGRSAGCGRRRSGSRRPASPSSSRTRRTGSSSRPPWLRPGGGKRRGGGRGAGGAPAGPRPPGPPGAGQHRPPAPQDSGRACAATAAAAGRKASSATLRAGAGSDGGLLRSSSSVPQQGRRAHKALPGVAERRLEQRNWGLLGKFTPPLRAAHLGPGLRYRVSHNKRA